MNRETSIAYAAGLFDGEGTIRPPGRSKQQNFCQLKVDMSCREAILFLHDLFGGTLQRPYQNKIPLKSGQPRRLMHAWWLNQLDDVHVALEAMLPYLIVKRDQAEAALVAIEAEMERRTTARSPRRARHTSP